MSEPTGAERYFAEQMKDPAYAESYRAARARIDAFDRQVNEVYDVLVELCGAPEELRVAFGIACEEPRVEFRFGGTLGFGGKIKREPRVNIQRWTVSYYPEHETPERRTAMLLANLRLQRTGKDV